jgi:hypothetical protein
VDAIGGVVVAGFRRLLPAGLVILVIAIQIARSEAARGPHERKDFPVAATFTWDNVDDRNETRDFVAQN